MSFLTGRGGVAAATLRGISVHPTACLSALCSVAWTISTERGDSPASSFRPYTACTS